MACLVIHPVLDDCDMEISSKLPTLTPHNLQYHSPHPPSALPHHLRSPASRLDCRKKFIHPAANAEVELLRGNQCTRRGLATTTVCPGRVKEGEECVGK